MVSKFRGLPAAFFMRISISRSTTLQETIDLDRRRVRQDVFVTAAAGDLAQQVDPTQIGDQGEVETGAQRLEIQAEGQSRRGPRR